MSISILDTIRLSPANLSVETLDTGIAPVSFKIPGTFNGFDGYSSSPCNGRYLASIDMWADIGEEGDRIYGFEIVDADGVIPVPARAQFPDYPTVFKFYDDQMEETENFMAGLQLRKGAIISLKSPSNQLNFIPSGLYVQGFAQAATATSGKVFRFNIVWGRYIATAGGAAVVS